MKRAWILPLLGLSAVLPGCVAALAAGAAATYGYVQYQDNEAREDFPDALEETWDACLSALQRMNYSVSSAAPLGPTEGEIEVDDIVLRAEAYPEGFTRVRVRVGTFDTEDNRRRARLILGEIRARLGHS